MALIKVRFHVQQIALLGFSYHLMPRPVFKHTSAELHQDPGTFEGQSTNWSTWLRLYHSSWFDWQSGQRTSVRRIIGLAPRLEGRNSLFVPKLHENQNEEHTHSKKLSCKKYLLFFTSVVKKFLIWNNNTYVLAKPFFALTRELKGNVSSMADLLSFPV